MIVCKTDNLLGIHSKWLIFQKWFHFGVHKWFEMYLINFRSAIISLVQPFKCLQFPNLSILPKWATCNIWRSSDSHCLCSAWIKHFTNKMTRYEKVFIHHVYRAIIGLFIKLKVAIINAKFNIRYPNTLFSSPRSTSLGRLFSKCFSFNRWKISMQTRLISFASV